MNLRGIDLEIYVVISRCCVTRVFHWARAVRRSVVHFRFRPCYHYAEFKKLNTFIINSSIKFTRIQIYILIIDGSTVMFIGSGGRTNLSSRTQFKL